MIRTPYVEIIDWDVSDEKSVDNHREGRVSIFHIVCKFLTQFFYKQIILIYIKRLGKCKNYTWFYLIAREGH
jgi:hypothetical protein